jgi:hypothetical protein
VTALLRQRRIDVERISHGIGDLTKLVEAHVVTAEKVAVRRLADQAPDPVAAGRVVRILEHHPIGLSPRCQMLAPGLANDDCARRPKDLRRRRGATLVDTAVRRTDEPYLHAFEEPAPHRPIVSGSPKTRSNRLLKKSGAFADET